MADAKPLRPVRAYLGLGSNIGDKIGYLRAALSALKAIPGITVVAASSIYRTPPWGITDQDWFANVAIGIDTTLEAPALLEACLAIEQSLGRVRKERWGPRVIDIDVLTYGDAEIDTPRLKVPHPAMGERAFVLIPLQEIAPNFRLNGVAIGTLLTALDGTGISPIDHL